MAREYDYVVSEVLRVSGELGFDPQDQEFTRTKFLSFASPDVLSTNVTKHDLFVHGGFARVKKDAALQDGNPSPQRSVDARGANARVLYARKLERELAKRDYFLKELKKTVKSVFKQLPERVPAVELVQANPDNPVTRTVLLSDLHFGVFILPHDVLGSEYNWTIAARRLAKVCVAAVEGTPHNLNVVLAGDIVHGVIHLSETGLRPITEQLCGANQLLTSALDFLSANISGKLKVTCVPGNHDRMVYKSSNRALSQRWDSYATLLYTSLKAAFRKDPRVTFSIPASGMAFIPNASGGLMLVAHGDVEPSSGNVGSSINVRALKETISKMRSANVVQKPVKVSLFGHWHTPTLQMLNDGSFIVVNGSLIGSDPYSQNALGIYNAAPAQVMFDSYADKALTNFRVVQVADADTDSALDTIIPTPTIIQEGEVL